MVVKSAIVTPEDVPEAKNFEVRTSSFFKHNDRLPTPEEVRSRARAQHLAGSHWGWKSRDVSKVFNARPSPAVFEDKSLFVKWGSSIKITEGQNLYIIRKICGDYVPVPEIYGWRADRDEIFLYMEAINGRTLEDAWPQMKEDDRLSICRDLRKILCNLRQLKQSPSDTFIGSITRSNYYERALFLESQPHNGPFPTVKSFHDWFTFQYKRWMPDPETVPEPYRKDLPDDSEIVFTHGDLHPSNIIVSSSSPPRVAALVDWEQSGWLPAYWEDRKAHWTTAYSGEWATKYLPCILDQHEDTREAWHYYIDPVGI